MKLTDRLMTMQLIREEEKELYYYGINQGFLLIFNIITMIFVGHLFNMILHSIIFMIAYGILRSYAGGYHANTPLGCYLFSVGMLVSVFTLIKFIPWNNLIYLIIMVISIAIILAIAPIENNNKTLDKKERGVFKNRLNIILSVLIGLTLILWFKGKEQVLISIIMAASTTTFMLILGKVKNIMG